jgi:hypothetical protein
MKIKKNQIFLYTIIRLSRIRVILDIFLTFSSKYNLKNRAFSTPCLIAPHHSSALLTPKISQAPNFFDGKSILDLGSGTGVLGIWLFAWLCRHRPHCGARIVVTDQVPAAGDFPSPHNTLTALVMNSVAVPFTAHLQPHLQPPLFPTTFSLPSIHRPSMSTFHCPSSSPHHPRHPLLPLSFHRSFFTPFPFCRVP